MSIPQGLTPAHIDMAIADWDAGKRLSHFKDSLKYALFHNGKTYPPKHIVALALLRMDGQTRTSEDFKGGEALGDTNVVLRLRKYIVDDKDSDPVNAFITKRDHALLTDEAQMVQHVWSNMWKKQDPPFKRLYVGMTLYWYDPEKNTQAITWQSRISKVEKFYFTSKTHLQQQVEQAFNRQLEQGDYFEEATHHGFCLAFKVDQLHRVFIPNPNKIPFHQNGWLAVDSNVRQNWLSVAPKPDGPFADELASIENEIENQPPCTPVNQEHERTKQLRLIACRRGQKMFRQELLNAYEGKCAVTDCDAESALEASHITPYANTPTSHISNGLLLRADIHTLFDLCLIGIDPATKRIVLASQLKNTSYKALHDKLLRLPENPAAHPNYNALEQRWWQFLANNTKSTPLHTSVFPA